MNPEYLAGVMCGEWAKVVEAIRWRAEDCPRRGWSGPLCRAVRVYQSFWRYRGGEVPLSAEALGLSASDVPLLLEAQRRFGKSAQFDALVVFYVDVLEKALLIDLAKLLGAI